MRKSQLLLLFFYLLPTALLFIVASWLFTNSYSEFISYLANTLQKPDWERYIQQRFTSSAFLISRWIVGAIILLYILFGIYLLRKRKMLASKIDSSFNLCIQKIQQGKNEFKKLPSYARWLLFILLLFVFLKGGWYIINWPLQYDEAWTYNYYIGNSFWQSFILPHNNHTFFTVVAWFFHLLPIDPQISMRLPNLLAGVAFIILFFFFIKRYISLHAALISTFFLATCCPVVFYMLYARGYLFVMLFTLISLWNQLIALEDKRSGFYKVILFAAIVLGYWSNPVFLYPHVVIAATTFLFIIKKRKSKSLRSNFIIHALSLVFVIILYLPTLLSSHIHELADKGVQQSFGTGIFWKSFFYNSRFIFGFDKAYILFFLIILAFVWISIKRKQFDLLQGFVLTSFTVIFLFSFLQSLPLAGHITIFFAISTAIMIAYIFNSIKISKSVLFLMLGGIAIFNSYMAHSHRWFNWSVEYDKSAKKIAKEMLKKNIQSAYLMVNYYKPHLEYYYKINDKKIRVNLQDSASQDYRPFYPTEQEVVITRTSKPSELPLQDYVEFYKDETVTAFIRTDVNR